MSVEDSVRNRMTQYTDMGVFSEACIINQAEESKQIYNKEHQTQETWTKLEVLSKESQYWYKFNQ